MTVKTTGGTGIAPAAVTAKKRTRRNWRRVASEVAARGAQGGGGASELRLYQGKLCGQAGPERCRGAGCRGGGRVLRQLRKGHGAEEWAVGAVYGCPDYYDDPPCKTIRKLTQKEQQKPPVPLDETCPKCGKPLLQRDGQYGEFIALQRVSEMQVCEAGADWGAVPELRYGDIAERKARRGNVFYGCTNYPKCDFTSNLKPIPRRVRNATARICWRSR